MSLSCNGTSWDNLVGDGTSWDKLGQTGTNWDKLGRAEGGEYEKKNIKQDPWFIRKMRASTNIHVFPQIVSALE